MGKLGREQEIRESRETTVVEDDGFLCDEGIIACVKMLQN